MDPIYVTGHRNPDTDSVVAAMAYAALRNALGDREYEAAILGPVSDETQVVLDRFGFQPPKRMYNVFTQVKDLDFDCPPILDTGVTVKERVSSRYMQFYLSRVGSSILTRWHRCALPFLSELSTFNFQLSTSIKKM